jgi:gluconokinase
VDEEIAGVWPALGDGACSNVGSGCVVHGRAAVTIGTSAAARVVYQAASAEPKPGLFLYRLDERRFCEGGALSDGGNLHAWLEETLRDAEPTDEPNHGLTFLPFLGGERSLGWNADRRGLIDGLTFATTPGGIAQAALEGVVYRLADVLDAIGELDAVVATGAALLANDAWVQVLADVLGHPVEVSGEPEGSARGAAVVALERVGVTVPGAPIERVVEPRPDRFEIHLAAREVQRGLMRLREAT